MIILVQSVSASRGCRPGSGMRLSCAGRGARLERHGHRQRRHRACGRQSEVRSGRACRQWEQRRRRVRRTRGHGHALLRCGRSGGVDSAGRPGSSHTAVKDCWQGANAGQILKSFTLTPNKPGAFHHLSPHRVGKAPSIRWACARRIFSFIIPVSFRRIAVENDARAMSSRGCIEGKGVEPDVGETP